MLEGPFCAKLSDTAKPSSVLRPSGSSSWTCVVGVAKYLCKKLAEQRLPRRCPHAGVGLSPASVEVFPLTVAEGAY